MPRLLIIALLALATQASAYKYSTFQFSTFPSSPVANGGAGIFLSPDDADPLAALSNPGMLGLMATMNRVSAVFYPNRAQWLPGFESFGFDWTYSARGAFVSWPQSSNGRKSAWLPIGIGYSEQYMDYGDISYVDFEGNEIGSYHSYEYSKNLHFGVSLQSALWRLGAGTGVRYMYARQGRYLIDHWEDRDMSGAGFDLGLWLDNNAIEGANRLFNWIIPDDVYLRPALGFAVTHIGPSVSDDDGDKYPIPRTARVTMAITGGVQVDHPRGGKWKLLIISAASEANDELTNRGHYGDIDYDIPPGRINPITNVLLGQSSEYLMQKKAFEFSFLEIFTIRQGAYTEGGPSNVFSYKTSGWSLSLNGMLSLASTAVDAKWFESCARHFDVQYAVSEESFPRDDSGLDSPRDGTIYKGVTVRWMR